MEGIPSLFIRPIGNKRNTPPKDPNIDLHVRLSRPVGRNVFIEYMAAISVIVVGIAAYIASQFDGAAGIIGTISLAAWLIACAEAVVEHSRTKNDKAFMSKDDDIVDEAVKEFKKEIDKIYRK